MDENDEKSSLTHPCSKVQNYVRPHSAKPKKTGSNVPLEPAAQRTRRPYTAFGQTRSNVSPRKVVRQHLRKSHLRPPNRPHATSPAPPTESVIVTAVALENLKKSASVKYEDQENAKNAGNKEIDLSIRTLLSEPPEESVSPPKPTAWAVRRHSPPGDDKPTHLKPKRSSRKRHPSVETWITGSPHDSDEYDTDLETDFGPGQERSIDPTGKCMYDDQCRKQGMVPVSYFQRHLGDRTLRMRHHYLGGEATRPVAAALQRNTITENLDLGDNFLEADGAFYLSHMLKENMFIVNLNISNNFIESRGAKAIAHMLEHNTTLKTLSIAGNQLTDSDAQVFIEALKNNVSLTSLDLSHNEFGEIGGVFIGSALVVNEGLTDLDISWNCIRNKGAVAIANALGTNSTLEVLDVSWNGFGMAGAKALEQALTSNVKLKVLDITNARLNTDAARSVAAGLGKNFGLETLILNLNPFGDTGVEAFLRAAGEHRSLRLLSMEKVEKPKEMSISRANYQRIQELEMEKQLTVLHGGVGGYQRFTSQMSVLRLFGRFIREHRVDLENSFYQQDKDKSGILSSEELKLAMKEAGLRLTNKQLEMLVDEIDYSHSGNIRYADVLSGQVIKDYYKQRPSRAYSLANHQDGRLSPQLLGNMGKQVTVI